MIKFSWGKTVALVLPQTKNLMSRGGVESVHLRRKRRRRLRWKGHKFQDAGLLAAMRVDSESLKRSILRARASWPGLVLNFGGRFSLRCYFWFYFLFGKVWWCFLIVSACVWFLEQTKINFVLFRRIITANIFSLTGKSPSLGKECNLGNFQSFYGSPPRGNFSTGARTAKLIIYSVEIKRLARACFPKSFLLYSGGRSNIVIFSRFCRMEFFGPIISFW